jgi:dihydrofolate reductase
LRDLIYSMTLSLDGYIAPARGGPEWAAPSPELHRFHNRQAGELGVHLLGRRLYEVMTFWETAEEDPELPDYMVEFARIWKDLPKIVYSKTLDEVVGNATLSHGDPVQEVAALKEENGKPLGVGGAELASTLTGAGLIDEYRLFMSPRVLGGGKPFFAGDTHVELEHAGTQTFDSGVVLLRYRRT